MTPRRPRADADWRVRAAGALLRASPGQIVGLGVVAVLVALTMRCEAVREVLCGPTAVRPLPKGPEPRQVRPPCPSYAAEAVGGCWIAVTDDTGKFITPCDGLMVEIPGRAGRCFVTMIDMRPGAPVAVERAAYSPPR